MESGISKGGRRLLDDQGWIGPRGHRATELTGDTKYNKTKETRGEGDNSEQARKREGQRERSALQQQSRKGVMIPLVTGIRDYVQGHDCGRNETATRQPATKDRRREHYFPPTNNNR